MIRTAYQDRMRDLIDLYSENAPLEPLNPTGGPLPPEPVKRQPYDEFYIWQRQDYWTGGLGE